MADYPGSIKTFTNVTDNVDDVKAEQINIIYDELTAVQTELGADVAGTATDLKTRILKSLTTSGKLRLNDGSELTISSGAITVTNNLHAVDTESDAATDDLITINGGSETGDVVILWPASSARNVVIKHGTGNIVCKSENDITLDYVSDFAILLYNSASSKWVAFGISNTVIDGSGTADRITKWTDSNTLQDAALTDSISGGVLDLSATLTTGRTLTIQDKDGVNALISDITDLHGDTKEPTGWLDASSITIAYNTTNRTITLTGDLDYYFNGVKYSLTSPWTSDAHNSADGSYYLYSTDGTTFAWSKTPWEFYHVQVAYAIKSTTPAHQFGLSELHGLMPWQTHEELHEQIGTFRESGGSPTAGTYAVNTQTADAVTPGFDAAVIQDEDQHTSVGAWTQGTYTTLKIGASSKVTFDTTKSYPYHYTAAGYINYNNTTTGADVQGATGKYYNVYQVMLPATTDTDSAKYRMVMLQPQRQFNSLAEAQAEDPRALDLGDLTSVAPEFVLYTRITYVTSASYSTDGKVVIATGGISYLSGSKLGQVSITRFSPSNHNDLTGLQGGTTDEYYHLTSAQQGLISGLPDYLQVEEQGSTPTTPGSGLVRIYAKTDGKLYYLDDTGTETEVGSGSGGGGSVQFHHWIDGTLAVLTDPVCFWYAIADGQIGSVVITGEDLGSASSTIVDIHKNGTTIFTTQANRPTLAYDDADDSASGTPDVTSYVAGDVFTAYIDQVATDASGLSIDFGNPSANQADIGARVYNSANITISNNTYTALTFNSERWDTDSIHSTSTNTGRLTCQTAGKYYISGNIRFGANATGVRGIEIKLNGTTVIAADQRTGFASYTNNISISTMYNLSASDYLELIVYQSSGGNLDIVAAGNYSPEFGMQKIG